MSSTTWMNVRSLRTILPAESVRQDRAILMGTALRFPVWKERKNDDGGNDMERFTLAQAAAWTKGEARGTAELTAVSTDSRQIPTEALFLPIKGRAV